MTKVAEDLREDLIQDMIRVAEDLIGDRGDRRQIFGSAGVTIKIGDLGCIAISLFFILSLKPS